MSERAQNLRVVEALLFASPDPLPDSAIAEHLPEDAVVRALLAELAEHYAGRGINLVEVANGWALRTAPDLAAVLQKHADVQRKLSRAAVETLAIVAYHQPVTRAEIEQIRGVSVSRGTLDILFEAGWIAPRGRRRTPGRPVTWATMPAFLDHFGLANLDDLPGLEELKSAGLLDAGPLPGALAAVSGGEDYETDPPGTAEEGEAWLSEPALDPGVE